MGGRPLPEEINVAGGVAVKGGERERRKERKRKKEREKEERRTKEERKKEESTVDSGQGLSGGRPVRRVLPRERSRWPGVLR